MKINVEKADQILQERRNKVFEYNYKWGHETIEGMFKRVAHAAAGDDKERQKRFFNALNKGYIVPGGRILRTLGRDDEFGLSFNCFAVPSPEDDLSSIYDTRKIIVKLLQKQGGLGVVLSSLRPKGAKIKTSGGFSGGVIPFMVGISDDVEAIQTTGRMRGAVLIALHVNHPDIEDFIEIKKNTTKITNANISVFVTDDFVDCVKNDKMWDLTFNGEVFKTVPARELWEKLIKANYDCGEPGIIFIDRLKRTNNAEYFQPVTCVNACTVKETVVVSKGNSIIPIGEICIPYDNDNSDEDEEKVNIDDLPLDQKTLIRKILKDGTVKEWYIPKRTKKEQNKEEKNPIVNAGISVLSENENGKPSFKLAYSGKKTGCEPLYGIVLVNGKEIRFTGEHELFVSTVKTKDTKNGVKEEQKRELRQVKYLQVGDKLWGIDLENNRKFFEIVKINYYEEKTDVYNFTVEKNHNYYIYVGNGMILSQNCSEQVLPAFKKDNGDIVIGSCNLGSLNLYKIICEHPKTWKQELSYYTTVLLDFLDCVLDKAHDKVDYLIELETDELVKKVLKGIKDTSVEARRVGLGFMGLASAMILKGIRYGSPESLKFIDEVMQIILYSSYMKSSMLSYEKGSFPSFNLEEFKKTRTYKLLGEIEENVFNLLNPSKGFNILESIENNGVRNSNIVNVAPNGSTGILSCASSGVEPIFDVFGMIRKDALGEYTIYDQSVIDWFRNHPNQIDYPDHFVGAMDLSLKEQVDVLECVIKYVENNISKTVNAKNDISFEEVKEMFYDIIYRDNLKSITFYRDGTRNSIITSSNKRERPVSLQGYSFKRNYNGDSFFITINSDIEGMPYEILTTCRKNRVLSDRLISTGVVLHHALKNMPDSNSILSMLEQMKDIEDGTKHYDSIMDKEYSSLSSSIAEAIEEFMIKQNLIDKKEKKEKCPKCGKKELVKTSKCNSCNNCGYSACSV